MLDASGNAVPWSRATGSAADSATGSTLSQDALDDVSLAAEVAARISLASDSRESVRAERSSPSARSSVAASSSARPSEVSESLRASSSSGSTGRPSSLAPMPGIAGRASQSGTSPFAGLPGTQHPAAAKEAFLRSADGNGMFRSGAGGPLDGPPSADGIDRRDWMALVLQRNPVVVELRERLRPLSRAESFAHIYNPGKTEVKYTLTSEMILQLIMQHLHGEGLHMSLNYLQEETGVTFIDEKYEESRLRALLRIAIKDVDRIWDEAEKRQVPGSMSGSGSVAPTRPATDIDFVDHLGALEVQLAHESVDDVPIWSEPTDPSVVNIVVDGEEVKSGTLNKLVERLTSSQMMDIKFRDTFVLTYRSFTTPEMLLEKLIQRYQVPPDKTRAEILAIQMRIFKFLRAWIDSSFFDFGDVLLEKLKQFIHGPVQADGNMKPGRQILDAIKRHEEQRDVVMEVQFTESPPEPKVPLRLVFSPKLKFEDIDEEEVARQITLIEWAMFKQIKPSELLNQAWSKARLKHRAQNVSALITRSNTFSVWTAWKIVSQEKLKDRKNMIIRFLRIAEHLRAMHNYNALVSIMAGLENAAVHRLKHTREEIPKRYQDLQVEVQRLFNTEGNYRLYRAALKTSSPPCIPFLGVYLTDLTFIEDGNPDFDANNLINFSKRKLVCDVIQAIQDYQQQAYNLLEVVQIQSLLTPKPADLPKDENALYQMSLVREPRNADRASIL